MHDDALTEGDSLQPRLLRFHGHGQVAQEQGAFKASELGHNRGGRRAAYVLRVAGPAPRQVYHPLPQGSTRQASIAWAADVPCARTIWPASESKESVTGASLKRMPEARGSARVARRRAFTSSNSTKA